MIKNTKSQNDLYNFRFLLLVSNTSNLTHFNIIKIITYFMTITEKTPKERIFRVLFTFSPFYLVSLLLILL